MNACPTFLEVFKNFMNSLKNYFRESFQEFNLVTWPTRRQAIRITVIVFIFTIASAIFIGVVDNILAVIYQRFI